MREAQIVTLQASWSVFAVHRLISYELGSNLILLFNPE